MKHQTRGFTLIEMLLVVALIVLLISVLLPSLDRARKAGRTVVCAAAQQRLSHAFQQYTFDNLHKSFVYAGNVGQSSFDNFWMGLLEQYSADSDQLRICPEASTLSDDVWGSADQAWSGHNHPDGYWLRSGGDFHYGSFGLNGWLYRGWGSSWIRLTESSLSMNQVPIFADSSWADGWPTTFDTLPSDFSAPYGPYAAGGPAPSQLGRWCVDRHLMAINVSFVDGSTRLMPLGDLWDLKWSRSFQPGVFDPGL